METEGNGKVGECLVKEGIDGVQGRYSESLSRVRE